MAFPVENEESTLKLLSAAEYTIAKPFFIDFKINQPILHSMLEAKSARMIFTDDKINPSFMFVYSPSGYAFLGGNPHQASLKQIAAYLKNLPSVSLVSPLDWKFKSFFLEAGFTALDRIQFKRHTDSFNLDFWESKLPIPYSIHRINPENFPRCNWHSFILSCYGDSNHFFANGMGFCLMDQGKIISESYGLIAANKAEIGVVTYPSYRGQNLGTSICAIMLNHCYQHHIEPVWSCDADNFSSAAIAKKLGFEKECKYFLLSLAQTPSA